MWVVRFCWGYFDLGGRISLKLMFWNFFLGGGAWGFSALIRRLTTRSLELLVLMFLAFDDLGFWYFGFRSGFEVGIRLNFSEIWCFGDFFGWCAFPEFC